MMKPMVLGLLTGAALAATLAGCNPAEKSAKEHSGAQPSYAASSSDAGSTRDARDSDSADRPDPREAPIPKFEGKPMWSANRKHTAQENAQYAFERNGEDFGARDLDAFLAKAHRFVSDPPAGVQKIKRQNGDVELYDAKTNTFAVVTKDGAPRTMFKPDDGPAYWAREEEKAANGGKSERTARKSSRKRGDDEG